ncbi:MAG: TetR/AcrR family transcriptional regulator [Coriobacteriia bacterium]
MGLREEKKDALEHGIYLAAIDLFARQGYAQTTLIDIADKAGVSTRTLYRYYPAKEMLLRKFIETNLNSLQTYVRELPEDMDLEEKVLSIMVKDFTAMFCPFDHVYVFNPKKLSSRQEEKRVVKFDKEDAETTEGAYRSLFESEQRKHGILPGKNTQRAASIIVAIYWHSTDLIRLQRIDPPTAEELRAYYAAKLDIIWDSLYRSLLEE